jgi:hypothetical protein
MARMSWSLIAAVNNESVLRDNLLRSPDLADASDVILKRGFANAGAAYNSALAEARGDLLIFVHQDVYLPQGWISVLEECVWKVSASDPTWGVLGVIGVNRNGAVHGHVYSTGLGRTVGKSFELPVQVHSIDEMVIILRRYSGLHFDPELPGYHLYGTDICLQSWQRGFPCFVIADFCLHNSNGIRRLPLAFWRSCLYLRSKWSDRLPLTTLCVTIRSGFLWLGVSMLDQLLHPKTPGHRVNDPSRLVQELCRTGQWKLASEMRGHSG